MNQEFRLSKSWTDDAGRCLAAQTPAARMFAIKSGWPRHDPAGSLASTVPIDWATADKPVRPGLDVPPTPVGHQILLPGRQERECPAECKVRPHPGW